MRIDFQNSMCGLHRDCSKPYKDLVQNMKTCAHLQNWKVVIKIRAAVIGIKIVFWCAPNGITSILFGVAGPIADYAVILGLPCAIKHNDETKICTGQRRLFYMHKQTCKSLRPLASVQLLCDSRGPPEIHRLS
jgi:hypothetical protein